MTDGLLKFPIDSEETASFEKLDNLLPQETYKNLVSLIEDSLSKLDNKNYLSGPYRSHHSILVDGKRGTGKTSVLVNLRVYIQEHSERLAKDILVLNPIDPTLLEDGDSLFLTIIVASVLSDESVIECQKRHPDRMIALNRALDKLATALESAEPDSTAKGMRKIRNMYDNNNLEGCVHDFFSAVLSLVDKKLLVLPIDDVDTSLNRAFENLEIIRRYLTSSLVLPIIGGDLNLYQEVIWRDFHYRLTKDSEFRTEQAFEQAVELANEYQRKVMPVSRRLTMPDVSSYLNSKSILLIKQKNEYMTLANFYAWLQIFLEGPVNGLENSNLPIPIKSIRALTQLLNRCQDVVPELPEGIRVAKTSIEAKRSWQMPQVSSDLFEEFYNGYYAQSREASEKRRYAKVFFEFAENYQLKAVVSSEKEKTRSWEKVLESHFMHEEDAGAVMLVLKAMGDWHNIEAVGSVFDTPLFKPLQQGNSDWSKFKRISSLDGWQNALDGYLPDSWLQKYKGMETILSYPVPQVGAQTKVSWQREQSYKDKKDTLLTLLTNYNFYSESKQSRMLNSGRIFEIMIHSLIAPVNLLTLQTIASKAPFYATNDLAPTKALLIGRDSEDNPEQNSTVNADDDVQGLSKLADDIAKWRERHGIKDLRVSPWLVYKVFNKLFTQLNLFVPSIDKADNAYQKVSFDLMDFTFNASWAAFASFEKGPLFGLPVTVATTNITSDSSVDFESNQHFTSNISPFTPRLTPLLNLVNKDSASKEAQARQLFGQATKTVTHVLADHPIRLWISEVLNENKSDKPSVESSEQIESKELPRRYTKYLKDEHNLELPSGADIQQYIKTILEMHDGIEIVGNIISGTPEQYKNSSNYKVLVKAIEKLQKDSE
ncbi:antiviral RADAR system adenosine triphosphatase RdrA [Vibrio alginolyticus]